MAASPTRHTGAASRGSSTSERPGGAMVWTWGFLGTKVPHLSWRGSQPSSQPGREKEGLPGQPLSTLECLFPLQRGHRTVTVQGSARGDLLIHRPCPLFCPTLTRPVDTQAELLGGWCAAPESGARLGPGAGEPPAVSSSRLEEGPPGDGPGESALQLRASGHQQCFCWTWSSRITSQRGDAEWEMRPELR